MPVILDISFGSVIGQSGNLTNIFNNANKLSFYEQKNMFLFETNLQHEKNFKIRQAFGPTAC